MGGLTRQDLQQERDQILQAQTEDIRALADLIQAVLDQENICVVGSEAAIEQNRNILKQVEPLVS